MTKTQKQQRAQALRQKYHAVDRGLILLILTVFQAVSAAPVCFADGKLRTVLTAEFAGFILFEWIYVGVMHGALKKKNFELEFIAFFLSGIGLVLIAPGNEKTFQKQLLMTVAGVFVYDALLWFIKDVKRVMAVRFLVGLGAIGFLGLSFAYSYLTHYNVLGAYNWLHIGPITLQPSEFVKVAFVFVGAASLDKLLTSKNIYLYIAFSMATVGILCLMKDFGTAMIYFATFLILAYLRSGDIRSLLFIGAGTVIGGVLALTFAFSKTAHVRRRLETYRHIWEYTSSGGWQQASMLVYAASGGLLGLGVGAGRVRTLPEGTTDIVFGLICEELGWIIAFAVVATYGVLAFYAVRVSRSAPSTFYSISACAAAGLLLFQAALNVFGCTDLLPFTGVTLPFVSQGGSSMICCWGLLAFLKAADIRAFPKVFRQ